MNDQIIIISGCSSELTEVVIILVLFIMKPYANDLSISHEMMLIL